jgi:hypothetical protein
LKIITTIFPATSRTFDGMRWVNILLRTTHLIGISGVGAGAFFQLPINLWLPYLLTTLISGCLMVLIEIWSNGIWLIQLRGQSTLIKLALLSLSLIWNMQSYMIFIAIVISGIFAHAPGKVRYYSIFHRKTIYFL